MSAPGTTEIRPADGVPSLWNAFVPGTAEEHRDLTTGQVRHLADQRGLTVVPDSLPDLEEG